MKHLFCFYHTILFFCTKSIRLNSAHYFIINTPNKQEFQSIILNHSSNIDFKDFVSPYKKSMTKSYSFLVNDTTLVSDNPIFLKQT